MYSKKYPKLKELLDAPIQYGNIGKQIWLWVTEVLPNGYFGPEIVSVDAVEKIQTLIRINYSERQLSAVFSGIDEIPANQLEEFVKSIVQSCSYQHLDKWIHYYKYTIEEYSLTDRGYNEHRNYSAFTENTGTGSNKYYGFNSSSGKNNASTTNNVDSNTTYDENISRSDNSRNPAELMEHDRAFWNWSYIQTMISDIMNDITLSIY